MTSAPKVKANVNASWGHDLHQVNNPQLSLTTRVPRNNHMARTTQKSRLYEAITAQKPRDGLSNPVKANKLVEEITIRGLAGPYVVIGTNFASGTTAADIESAMVPSGGEMHSCRIIASDPTVIAEMVFVEKANAERVIATFNNKRVWKPFGNFQDALLTFETQADGRILHVYMKQGGPANPAATPVPSVPSEPRVARHDLARVEPSYNVQREESDRNRRQADPEFQDGSYGFEAKDDRMDVEMDNGRESWQDATKAAVRGSSSGYRGFSGRGQDDRRLYSDDLYPPRGRGFR